MKALTLRKDLRFDLTFVCQTCGAYIKRVKCVEIDSIPSLSDGVILDHDCRCGGGDFVFPPCMLTSPILPGFTIDSRFVRLGRDGHYLREAFENPTSRNICTCPARFDHRFLVSFDRTFPFLCSGCNKFWFHKHLGRVEDVSYGFIRSIQINMIASADEHWDCTFLSEWQLAHTDYYVERT